MASNTSVLRESIQKQPVVAILRAPSAANFSAAVDILVSHGIRHIEVTMTSEGAVAALETIAARADPTITLGIGSVTRPEQVLVARDAGATFVVTPAWLADVIEVADEHGLPTMIGALTPSEVVAAAAAGASFVKIFPARSLGGARYIQDLRGPLPDIPLLPTGGVTFPQIREYLAAGAAGVGLGSSLVPVVGRDIDIAGLRTASASLERELSRLKISRE